MQSPVSLDNLLLTAIDFETTGTAPGWSNEPWQIGICRFVCHCDAPPDIVDTFSSLLYIPLERPFNPFTPGRHSKLRQELAASPALYDIWSKIFPLISTTPLVAHNIGTERTILRRIAPLHHLGPWIDTLPLSRSLFPTLSAYSLEELAPSFQLEAAIANAAPAGSAPHDALYDAIACAMLLGHFATIGLHTVLPS